METNDKLQGVKKTGFIMGAAILVYGSAEITTRFLGSGGAVCFIMPLSIIHLVEMADDIRSESGDPKEYALPIFTIIMPVIMTLALTHLRQDSETLFDPNLLCPSFVISCAILNVFSRIHQGLSHKADDSEAVDSPPAKCKRV